MKRMIFVAATITALVVIAIGVADPIGARPDKRLILEGSFRITAQDVLRDDDTLVSRIEIETHPGAIVRIASDIPNAGGLTTVVSEAIGPSRPVHLMVFGDHVKWEAGRVDALKFLMRLDGKSGGAASMSNTGAMPPTNAKLSEVLAVTARSGVYPEGGPIPVVTFTGTIYNLVVERPRR